MIKFIGPLPKRCVVAFSGGVDSVSITDFLIGGRRDLELAFFHHGTPASEAAQDFVTKFSIDRGLPLRIGRIDPDLPAKGLSQEEYWRDQRYAFLDRFDDPVITCHHLDDAVETWIFTSLHGNPRLIPRVRGNVLRPFLVTQKSELIEWASRRGLEWSEDTSNADTKYARNRIRHNIVPEALKINPGLRKTIRKKYLDSHSSI